MPFQAAAKPVTKSARAATIMTAVDRGIGHHLIADERQGVRQIVGQVLEQLPFEAGAREGRGRGLDRLVQPRREALVGGVAVELHFLDLDIRPAPALGLRRHVGRGHVPDEAVLVVHRASRGPCCWRPRRGYGRNDSRTPCRSAYRPGRDRAPGGPRGSNRSASPGSCPRRSHGWRTCPRATPPGSRPGRRISSACSCARPGSGESAPPSRAAWRGCRPDRAGRRRPPTAFPGSRSAAPDRSRRRGRPGCRSATPRALRGTSSMSVLV